MGSSFSSPPESRYFEDYVVGVVHEFGPIAVEEEEVIRFGRRFLPLPYHTDADLARQTPFGRLIASGWHTISLAMRLYTDHFLSKVANLGSPGADELRWSSPVYPGDELRIRISVLEARLSRTRPDRGVVRSFVEVLNQHGRVVASLKTAVFVAIRPG